MKDHIVYIMGGGNVGDTAAYLREAGIWLNHEAGKVMRTSQLYQTEPWGFAADQPFLNQGIELHTALSPQNLLHVLQQIEQELGRIRISTEYASRTLDLDIIFYDHVIINTPTLCIPHPQMHLRMFVLIPLAELIPRYIHPVLQESVEDLQKNGTDLHRVEQYRP